MLTKKRLLVFITLLAVGLFWWWIREEQPQPVSGYSSQTASLGEVEVEVRPEKLGRSEKENIFSVTFNTHSVNLDFDFGKIISLIDDLGNRYQALSWTGGQGGHHLEGKLVFPKLAKEAKKVVLKISGIGKEESFTWEL